MSSGYLKETHHYFFFFAIQLIILLFGKLYFYITNFENYAIKYYMLAIVEVMWETDLGITNKILLIPLVLPFRLRKINLILSLELNAYLEQ